MKKRSSLTFLQFNPILDWIIFFFLQNSRAQKEKISNWRTMGKICLLWINICWTRNPWKIFLWIRTLELFYQRWRFGTRDSKFKTRNNKWKGSISVILVFFYIFFFKNFIFFSKVIEEFVLLPLQYYFHVKYLVRNFGNFQLRIRQFLHQNASVSSTSKKKLCWIFCF